MSNNTWQVLTGTIEQARDGFTFVAVLCLAVLAGVIFLTYRTARGTPRRW